MVDWFAAKCAAGPLLFVIKNLHLCDPTTIEFLEHLLARGRTLPLMILATARPEFAHDFGNEAVTTLTLMRLARTDTDDLVREIFDSRAVSTQILDILAERTDGVPLFVEELLKSLAETGAIAQVVRRLA